MRVLIINQDNECHIKPAIYSIGNMDSFYSHRN